MDPATGHVGMVQSRARGGSDWTLGCIYLPRQWSNTVQASWRWGCCPKPVNVERAFGKYCLQHAMEVARQLDSIIIVGPFQEK